MHQIEALREVKRAEDEVKQRKEEAQRESQKILREAREQAAKILADAESEAHQAYNAGIDNARKGASGDRQKILAEGEKRAEDIRKAAAGPQFQKAVDTLLKRFNDNISG